MFLHSFFQRALRCQDDPSYDIDLERNPEPMPQHRHMCFASPNQKLAPCGGPWNRSCLGCFFCIPSRWPSVCTDLFHPSTLLRPHRSVHVSSGSEDASGTVGLGDRPQPALQGGPRSLRVGLRQISGRFLCLASKDQRIIHICCFHVFMCFFSLSLSLSLFSFWKTFLFLVNVSVLVAEL